VYIEKLSTAIAADGKESMARFLNG
jgi:hypothetical protein